MATGYIRGFSAFTPVTKQGAGRKIGHLGSKDKHDHNKPTDKHVNYKGAQIQNVKAATVYVFGHGDHTEDDETVEFEMPEMRSRYTGNSHSVITNFDELPEYFEREIVDGETLQAIALRYACPVSELKRLNNLIQDQDFYALKILRVPMKKYGIISEQIANELKTAKKWQYTKPSNESDTDLPSSDKEGIDSQHDFSDHDTQIKVLRTLSIKDNVSSHGTDAEKFLEKMDNDLTKLKQASRLKQESLSEVISVMTNKSIHPLQTSRPSVKQNGATCGISWWSILFICLIIGVAVPLVAYFYFKYNSHI